AFPDADGIGGAAVARHRGGQGEGRGGRSRCRGLGASQADGEARGDGCEDEPADDQRCDLLSGHDVTSDRTRRRAATSGPAAWSAYPWMATRMASMAVWRSSASALVRCRAWDQMMASSLSRVIMLPPCLLAGARRR